MVSHPIRYVDDSMTQEHDVSGTLSRRVMARCPRPVANMCVHTLVSRRDEDDSATTVAAYVDLDTNTPIFLVCVYVELCLCNMVLDHSVAA